MPENCHTQPSQVKYFKNKLIKPEIFMIEKFGKQENLPQKMGIISILKMENVIFLAFS